MSRESGGFYDGSTVILYLAAFSYEVVVVVGKSNGTYYGTITLYL